MSASDYRLEIADAAQRYAGTPGGPPPPPVLESIVYAESGGDPRLTRGDRRGLAMIAPDSEAWKWYIASDLDNTYGTDAVQVLHQPEASIEILALEMNRRQEQGIAAQEAGEPAALRDWYMASLARRGWADNDGLTRDGEGRDALAFHLAQKQYVSGMFGAQEYAAIDAQEGGQVIVNQQGSGLHYVDDEPVRTPPGMVLDTGKDAATVLMDTWPQVIRDGATIAKGSIGTGIAQLVNGAGALVTRAGLYLAGALLALVGLYLAFR